MVRGLRSRGERWSRRRDQRSVLAAHARASRPPLAAWLCRGLVAVAAVALLATPAAAASAFPTFSREESGTGEVTVDAASIRYDQRNNVIEAEGAVKVTRGEMTLTADKVRVNRATQVAEAEGNVVVTDPQGTTTADALTLNLVEETGAMDNGSVFLKQNHYQLSGRRFEKFPGQSYLVEGGRFTTCMCGEGNKPSWSVRGERVLVDFEGYGRVKGATFEVLGRPIAYLPYGLFPIRRERQSGFLFPRFGASNRRGFQIEQPFYFAINKSMDATVSLDIETAARIGVLGEYRYALSKETLGVVHGSYFNEQIRGAASNDVVNSRIADPSIPVNRWSLGLTHDQHLPAGVKGFADVFRVSDDLFLREINVFTFSPGVDVALRTRRFERSRVGAERLFDRGLLMATATWYQDFINPDRFDFQTPPRVGGFASAHLFDDRLLVHFQGEGVNFERDKGFQGQRLDLQPEIELPWRWQQAYGSVRGGFRETAYTLDDTSVPTQVNVNPADPGSKPPSILPTLDDNATREVFYLRGETGTSLARVYPFDRFGISRLKHTIEPTVDYLFVPRTTTRQSALPLFDDVDRVNQRSIVTYGVTSRLLARMKPHGAKPKETKRRGSKKEKARAPGINGVPSAPPDGASEHDGAAAGDGEAESAGGAGEPDASRDPDLDEALATGAAYDETSMGPQLPPGPASRSKDGAIRELGRFALFQSYDFVHRGGDFIDQVDPQTGMVRRDDGDRISDLSAYLRLTPVEFLSFEGRTDLGLTTGRYSGASVGLSVADPRTPSDDFSLAILRGRSRFSIGYRFVARSAIEEVNGSMLLRLTKRFYAAYEARYDNLSKRFLENRYGFRMISDCECWVVDVGVSDKINPNETEVRVLVSLVGLGQFGKEPFQRSLASVTTPSLGFLGQ